MMPCPHSVAGWCLDCVKELYVDLATVTYAAEEWCGGRITDADLREVITKWRETKEGDWSDSDECPACGGIGGGDCDTGGTYPSGEWISVWQQCELCGGSGVFSERDE
jgi:hypothetical protein